jgi:hypothetical protein
VFRTTGPLRLVSYADASFGGNADHSSQKGCLLLLVDTSNKAHILHWFSRKIARVTISILTAETLAVAAAVDVDAMRLYLSQMGLEVALDVLTDSKQLYTALQGHGSVTEKRLMTDIAALRQTLRRKKVTRRLWQITIQYGGRAHQAVIV